MGRSTRVEASLAAASGREMEAASRERVFP
jgi:hypothetical protein